MGEYRSLWLEYTERFGIDFSANADRIEFVETMRVVRNQIVYDGAEAVTFKFNDEIDWTEGVLAFQDSSFSEKYPDYVSGNEVSVSQEQLDKAVEASLSLVGWLAKELRARRIGEYQENKRHVVATPAEMRGHTVAAKLFYPESLSELTPEFF